MQTLAALVPDLPHRPAAAQPAAVLTSATLRPSATLAMCMLSPAATKQGGAGRQGGRVGPVP